MCGLLRVVILNCFHNHLSLLINMIMKCFPISSYMWPISFCVQIVCEFVLMLFFGLHSLIEMCANGMIVMRVIYLISLF